MLTTIKDDNCFEVKGNDADKTHDIAEAMTKSLYTKNGKLECDKIHVYGDNIEIPHFR